MPLLKNPIRSEELLGKTLNIKHRFYASSSEPLQFTELLEFAKENGDQHLIDLFYDHSLGYADNGGSLDLRQEVAKLYGAEIKAENIVIFPGAQTGMTLTAQAILRKGDHSIVVTPSYQSLEEGIKLAGSDISRVSISPANGWRLNLTAVEAAIQPNTKYLVFNDPHNPSGALMSEQEKLGLIALADKYDLQIFSDEVYRLLEVDPADRSASMVELSTRAIALGTLSKPWGAGGTGIGWVACADTNVIKKLIAEQHIYAVCFARAGEIQAMMALRAKEQIIGRNMKIIKDNLVLLDRYFAENVDLFEWIRPKAGGTGFVKFKGPLSGEQLAEQLLDAQILVFPPSIFDCEGELNSYIRIGFSRKTMPAALKAFKKFIKEKRIEWQANS